MSDGERRGGRRRRKRRRGVRVFLPTTRRARLAAVGGLVAIGLVVVVVAVLTQRPESSVPTGKEYHLARLALGAGDLDTALAQAESAVEQEPGSREARLLLALVLRRLGRTREASQLLESDVRKDPDYDDGRVLLAAFAMRDEDYATALVLLRDAVERAPTPSSAWRLLGDIRGLTGDRDGAVTAYEQATTAAPDDLRAWLALGDVQLDAALDTGSVVARDEAGRAYEAAERICRRELRSGVTPQVRLALAKALAGRARATRGSSLEAAEHEIRTLVDGAGDDVEPTLALAAFLSGIGRDSDARAELEAAERRWPTSAPRRALARVLESLGENAEAVAVLRRAVAGDLRDVRSRVALVDLLSRLGRYDDAANELAAAPEDADGAWRVHETAGDLARARARAAEQAGEVDAAFSLRVAVRAAYDRALALRPRSMPLQKKRFGAILEAGALRPAELSAADRQAALGYVQDVLELNPADVDALAWRARLLLLDDAPEDAFELLGAAAADDAPSIDLLRLYGVACERTGRDDLAADAYARVLTRMTRGDGARGDPRGAPADAWAAAARGALLANRPALAESTADSGIAAWPDALELHLLLATTRLLGGRDAAALAGLAAAGESDALATVPEVPVLVATIHERRGRRGDAERVLRDAVARSDHADLHFALARLAGRRGAPDELRSEIAAALALTPDPANAALREGEVLLSLRPPDVDGARAAFERAASGSDDPRVALLRLADLALLSAGAGSSPPGAAREAVTRCEEAGVSPSGRDYLRGKLALLEGEPDVAVQHLERAVVGGARSVATLYYLARARRTAGDGRRATAALERALQLDPADERMRRELALLRADVAATALAEGRTSEALLLLEQLGDASDLTLLLATARVARLDLALAEPLVRAHLEDHSDDAAALHLLAAILTAADADEGTREAATIYARLLDASPTDVHAMVGLAAARATLGDTVGAAAAWERAAEARPDDAAILRGRVQALVASGRADEALAHVESVVAGGDAESSTRALHADLLLHVGRADDAVSAYLRVADADTSDVGPVLGAAATLAGSGREEEARRLLAKRVPRCDDARAGWRALGDLRARAGDLDGAQEALERAAGGVVPSGYEILLRGEVAEVRGDAGLALQLYDSNVSEDDARPVVLRRLAALLTAAGETRRAIDAYDALLRWTPDDVAAINNRALLLAEDDDQLPLALAEARRARGLSPERAEIADTLGWLLVRDAKPSDARSLLEAAAGALPGDARVHFHLGVCLARLGHVDDARKSLEHALSLDPVFPGADAARAQLERLR